MKTPHALLFSILAFFLIAALPVFAAGDPLINQARDLLHAALNPGGDPPSNADKIKDCQEALQLLKKSAAVYHGQRAKAIESTQNALLDLNQGDPDNKANDFIRQALDLVRDIT